MLLQYFSYFSLSRKKDKSIFRTSDTSKCQHPENIFLSGRRFANHRHQIPSVGEEKSHQKKEDPRQGKRERETESARAGVRKVIVACHIIRLSETLTSRHGVRCVADGDIMQLPPLPPFLPQSPSRSLLHPFISLPLSWSFIISSINFWNSLPYQI